MHRLPKQNYHDIERIIEFDFVRATEAAALNSLRWLSRGDKEKADAAACDAMRGMFDLMNICGEVVIGEGIWSLRCLLFTIGPDERGRLDR